MINIWGTTFLVGPFLGLALAGYILDGTKSWRAVFGVLTGLYSLSTVVLLHFARETYYNRSARTSQTSRAKSFLATGNTNLPKLPTMASSISQPVRLLFTLSILLVGLCTMVNFTWPIGITTTIDAILHGPPYMMANVPAAGMRFAGVIGAILGFAFGYFLNERIYHGTNGARKPHWRSEYRFHGIWVPVTTMAAVSLCMDLH